MLCSGHVLRSLVSRRYYHILLIFVEFWLTNANNFKSLLLIYFQDTVKHPREWGRQITAGSRQGRGWGEEQEAMVLEAGKVLKAIVNVNNVISCFYSASCA